MPRLLLLLFAAAATVSLRAADHVPTIDQLLELKRPTAVAMSPDGTRIAVAVSETNWEDNAFETEIFLVDARGAQLFQLTRARKSSTAPAWSPFPRATDRASPDGTRRRSRASR